YDLARAVFGSVATILTIPFVAAVVAVIYFDLRVRKEGFDLQLMAQRIGAPDGAVAPALMPWTSPAPGAGGGGAAPPPPAWGPGPAAGAATTFVGTADGTVIVTRLLAGQVDPDQARDQAREILDGRRYKPAGVPRPFEGTLDWLGDRLRPIGDFFSRITESLV